MMKRVMYLSVLSILLLLALNTSAEDVSLQAAVPNNAGTIELTVTLDVANPAVLKNDSGIAPGPSAVPEPSTLVLVGLGVLGVVGWRRRSANNGTDKRES